MYKVGTNSVLKGLAWIVTTVDSKQYLDLVE